MVSRVWPLTRRALMRRLDGAAIEAAIQRAEASTSAELRVCVAGFFRGGTRALAERAFRKLGMDRTRHRNAVLILLAPTRRHVVVLGDEAIAARVPATFWSERADSLARRFAGGDFTAGLIEAIAALGDALARHFPTDGDADGINELPDTLGRA